ncbi:MAG TPA: heterodisulfide reductase, partial [Desulfobacteraceae bacterium]|nr:heterodisulfide reductase [Desulfobacteraceae bacterium]
THEPLFQETLRDAGLNKYLVEMANIRNQCSWVHAKEPELATEKSKDLVRIAVAKAALMNPLDQPEVGIVQKGLVIGGGVAGMTAALGLADQGFHTYLIEKGETLGGYALSLDHAWTHEPIAENVKAMVARVQAHEGIEVLTGAEVAETKGFVGNFNTIVKAGGLNGDARDTVLDHGAVIIATGAKAGIPDEYLYGKDPRVFNHVDLDPAMRDNPDMVKKAASAVFIQCVGSREEGRPYCSKVCCTHSIKKAIQFKEINPDMDVYVLYRDIRTYGRRESLYRQARDKGVIFIRYSPSEKPVVTAKENCLDIQIKERILGMDIHVEADFLVLASAIVAEGNEDLAQKFKLTLNDDKFFMEAHAKLRPVDFATDGVFLCGTAHYPKPVEECIAQAKAAASRAIRVLSRDSVTVDGVVSDVDSARCRGCGACEAACPFGAIETYVTDAGVTLARVQQALCKGCSACTVACPTGAAGVSHYNNEVLAMVEAALEEG